MNIKGGFYFIATILDVKITLPVNITPTLSFEKATDSQIETIKKSLDYLQCYESECIIEEQTPTSSRYSFEELERDKWRYYVIAYSGSNYETHLLFSIADIIDPNLSSFLHYHTKEEFGVGEVNGWGRDTLGATAFYQKIIGHYTPKTFDQEGLTNLQNLFGKYKDLDKGKYEGIIRAIDFNSNLQRLSRLTELPVLGFFVIIEMLLTHNPNDKEIGDSLTHQIKTKIAFISPRLTEPLDYSSFDSSVTPDKIWGALYEYRSCIAHGNHIDFSRGKIAILKNANAAYDFLNAATRKILAYSIIEPDVVNGLKPI